MIRKYIHSHVYIFYRRDKHKSNPSIQQHSKGNISENLKITVPLNISLIISFVHES